MQYKVLIAVRPRSQPTMTTNDSGSNVPAGTIFNSSISQVDPITSSHPTMLKLDDTSWESMWLPLVYLGKKYCEEIIVAPPTGIKHFSLSVDGYQTYEGNLTPLV